MTFKSCLYHFIRSWEKQPAVQAATLSSIAGAFVVISAALVFQQNLDSLITKWGTEISVNVYLSENTSDKSRSELRSKIESSKLFTKIDYISKNDAVVRFQKRLGSMAPTFFADGEFENPLPESFEMIMSRSADSVGAYNKLVEFAAGLRSFVGVEEVSYGQEWLENYASTVAIVRAISWGLIFILLAGSLLVIGNAIRSGIYQQKQEIEILELFGATRNMIIAPFVFEGAILGFVSSLVSLFISYALYSWFLSVIGESLSFWNLKDHLVFMSFPRVLLFIFLGTFVGALGSLICVKQVSTGWAAAESRNS